jgi:hypothetical protein
MPWLSRVQGLTVAVGSSPYRCLSAQDQSNAQLFLTTCNPRMPGQNWGVTGSTTPAPALANQVR